jgi:small subunit ribosomal protein S6
VIKTLETAYRRDERVIRFLTFAMDKFAVEYAAKRKSLKSSKKEEAKKED